MRIELSDGGFSFRIVCPYANEGGVGSWAPRTEVAWLEYRGDVYFAVGRDNPDGRGIGRLEREVVYRAKRVLG